MNCDLGFHYTLHVFPASVELQALSSFEYCLLNHGQPTADLH